ncbi:MAG: PAS domain-containing sensor histidine kinase [Candidatus Xenobia bacterium]
MTERRAATEGRMDAAALGAMLNSLGEVVWSCRAPSMELSFINRAGEKVFGVSVPDLLAQPGLWLEMLHPEDREQALAELGAVRAGEPQELEFRILRSDGTVRWVLLRASQGAPDRLDGIAIDVTERKRTEERLRDSNEMLQAIIRSSPLAIITLDVEGNVRNWNPAAVRMFGWTEDEVVGRPHPIIPITKKEEFKVYFDKVLAGAHLHRVEVRRDRKDGLKIDISVTTAPLHDQKGGVTGMVGVLADITERKRAAEQKETVSDISRLFLIFEGLDSIYRALPGMLSMRFQFPIVAIALHDEQAHELVLAGSVGLPGDQDKRLPVETALAGQVLRSGQPLVDSDVTRHPQYETSGLAQLGARTLLCVAMKMGERVLGVLTLADTRSREVEASLVDAVQVISNYLAQAIERKRAEEEIRQLNASLERRVTDRTQELQEAVKELESFSYSVSHDLRAPLRAIDGFSRILLEDYAERLDDEGRSTLNVIINNTRKMGQLIDDLLAFSRLGRKPIEGNSVNMQELARAVFDEVRQTNPGREMTVPAPLPRAWGDVAMIRQVLTNLLSNAVKFTRKREQPLVELSGEVQEDGMVRYRVRDNGAGFDMAYADKLFGVFQRLHRPQDYEGTGVGLAIVQRIVMRHGGRVWAEAEVDKGATFYFTLPSRGPQPG